MGGRTGAEVGRILHTWNLMKLYFVLEYIRIPNYFPPVTFGVRVNCVTIVNCINLTALNASN